MPLCSSASITLLTVIISRTKAQRLILLFTPAVTSQQRPVSCSCSRTTCQRSLYIDTDKESGKKTSARMYRDRQSRKHPKEFFPCLSSRKEVFQPHLPVRLPCYDLAPITSFALGRSLRSRTSGAPGFHGLTGGVYKARERIHRAMADARLLANPASWGRVADPNPNYEAL